MMPSPRAAARLPVASVALAALALATLAAAQSPPSAGVSAAPGAKADTEQQQATMADDKSAIDAAKKWLDIVDRGNTGPLWDDAAKPLKSSVTRVKWMSGLRDARKPYGKLGSRKAVKFARTHELPDAPAADYAIVEFESQFANGKRAVEHVVWMLESDGVWRVSGYFIR